MRFDAASASGGGQARTPAKPGATGARGERWALATPHRLATEAGAEALRGGGSAIDAALAAAAALTVVYPHNTALGGDVVALVATPDGEVVMINGSGATATATNVAAVRAGHHSMPTTGAHTVTVPGAVAAWEEIHARGARRPLADSLAAAIAHAEDGAPVAPSLASALAEQAPQLARDDGMRAVLFDCDGPLRAGVTLRQPALARSLRALADDGAAALYDGPLGTELLATLRPLGSALTKEDFRRHATEVAAPLSGSFGCLELLTSPPNTQGFLLLEIAAALDAAAHDTGGVLNPLSADAPLLAELFRLATRDRERHLADPRHAAIGLEELLAPDRAARWAEQARSRLSGGAAHRSEDGNPVAAAHLSGDTVAVVAADAEGYAVSLIQSVFHAFGSGILDPLTGIICHNRGASFTLDSSAPNVLAASKRPAHTLMPLMARRAGRLLAVTGTMGGKAQPQIHAHLLLHLRAGKTVAEAVDAPRWIVGGTEIGDPAEVVLAERRVPEPARQALRASGFERRELEAFDETVGHAQALVHDHSQDGGSVFRAASDPRCDGAAAAG